MSCSKKWPTVDKLVKQLKMWGLGPRVDKQGSSFCRRGSGAQLSSGRSMSSYLL